MGILSSHQVLSYRELCKLKQQLLRNIHNNSNMKTNNDHINVEQVNNIQTSNEYVNDV